MNFFSPCLLRHSSSWTYIRVNGQLTRACDRCQAPLAAILGHRGNSEDIQPAKVPEIIERHAQVKVEPKPKRQRKPKSTPAARPVTPFEKRQERA